MENDSEDSADMCELVRGLIASGHIEVPNIKDLRDSIETIKNAIDCPGEADDDQSEICAITGGSSAQGYSWYILLEGGAISVGERPALTWTIEQSPEIGQTS
jgi:hypothetical protein